MPGSEAHATYLCFYSGMNDVCGLCGSLEARFQLLVVFEPCVHDEVCNAPFLHYLPWIVFPVIHDTGTRVGLTLYEGLLLALTRVDTSTRAIS